MTRADGWPDPRGGSRTDGFHTFGDQSGTHAPPPSMDRTNTILADDRNGNAVRRYHRHRQSAFACYHPIGLRSWRWTSGINEAGDEYVGGVHLVASHPRFSDPQGLRKTNSVLGHIFETVAGQIAEIE